MKSNFCCILFWLFGMQSWAQCPPNIDFEQGDFSYWQCFTGNTTSRGNTNVINLNPSPSTTERHTLISSSTEKDYFGEFPVLCPFGGNYSVKLGNTEPGKQAEGISYTFVVSPTVDTFTFTYFYAVVFEDPGHDQWMQPRFFVTAYEVATGDIINCAAFNYVSSSNLPGFLRSPKANNVWYKNWTPVSLQFAGLQGKEVRLEFKNADCTLGGHFGYSYLDVSNGCSNILATAPYCIETNSLTLNAPYGFQNYIWYDSTFTTVLGTEQNLTLKPAPVTTGSFYVDVIPYPGFGCRDTFQATARPLSIPPKPKTPLNFYFCRNQPNALLDIVADSGNVLIWYTNDTLSAGTEIPPAINTSSVGSRTYYVSQKQLFGCEGYRQKIEVHIVGFSNSDISVNNARQCLSGNKFILNSTASINSDILYSWFFGNGDSLITNSDTAINYTFSLPGIYYVNLYANYNNLCISRKNVALTVIPIPQATFTTPSPICEKQTPVTFTDVTQSIDGSATSGWWWNINGAISSAKIPPVITPTSDTPILVKFVVKTSEGCYSDTTVKSVLVQQRPEAMFSVNNNPVCSRETLLINDSSFFKRTGTNETVNKWNWSINNTVSYTSSNIRLVLGAGLNNIKLNVESNFGCKSTVFDSSFIVHTKPHLELLITDSCINVPVSFIAKDTFNLVNNWFWNFGTGFNRGGNTVSTYYSKVQSFSFTVAGTTPSGCVDSINRMYSTYDNIAFAGKDTVAAFDQPVQLDAKGYPLQKYWWTPVNFGLSNDTIRNPVALYNSDFTYYLHSVTKEGCKNDSKILIKRYAGPALYIAKAFTPNGDKINDVLHVFPVGIKKFNRFSIYNRWGNLVFSTTDPAKGWDGRYKGELQSTETFVVYADATDYRGNPLTYKGNVILIR